MLNVGQGKKEAMAEFVCAKRLCCKPPDSRGGLAGEKGGGSTSASGEEAERKRMERTSPCLGATSRGSVREKGGTSFLENNSIDKCRPLGEDRSAGGGCKRRARERGNTKKPPSKKEAIGILKERDGIK